MMVSPAGGAAVATPEDRADDDRRACAMPCAGVRGSSRDARVATGPNAPSKRTKVMSRHGPLWALANLAIERMSMKARLRGPGIAACAGTRSGHKRRSN